jgi:hypothetical protein
MRERNWVLRNEMEWKGSLVGLNDMSGLYACMLSLPWLGYPVDIGTIVFEIGLESFKSFDE